jgi:hypothetical protein
MITEILNEWFDESKIEEKNRVNYIVLCDYYNEEKTFKCKHYKKLKKRFKKEIQKETK